MLVAEVGGMERPMLSLKPPGAILTVLGEEMRLGGIRVLSCRRMIRRLARFLPEIEVGVLRVSCCTTCSCDASHM